MAKLTTKRRTSAEAAIFRLRTAYKRALKKSKDDVIEVIKAEIENQMFQKNLVATGDLLKSLDSDFIEIDAFGYAINVGFLDAAAIYVEEGRGAGDLPYSEIVRWADAKGIDEQFVPAIYQKIKKHGFYGKDKHGAYPIADAAANVEEKLVKIVEDNLDQSFESAAEDFRLTIR